MADEPRPTTEPSPEAPRPPARGSRLDVIRRANEDAIVVAREEAPRRQRQRTLLRALGAVAATAVVVPVAWWIARADGIWRPTPTRGATTVVPAPPVLGSREITDEAAAAKKLAGLKDPDESKRRGAAEDLGHWARSAMMSMTDPGARFPIVAAAALAVAARDDAPRVREAVAAALGGFPPSPEGVEALTGLLKDRDPGVRATAAVALCRLAQGDVAAEALADAWDEKAGRFAGAGTDEALRLVGTSRGSYRAFNQGDRSAPVVQCLVDGLKDPDRAIRLAAARALAQLGAFEVPADRVPPALVRVLRSRDPARRQKAAETLRGLGVEAADAIEPLKEAARDRDPEVRRLASELLRQVQAAARDSAP